MNDWCYVGGKGYFPFLLTGKAEAQKKYSRTKENNIGDKLL